MKRPTDIPEEGLLCDILWSDPLPSRLKWEENCRGISVTFNATALKQCCDELDIDLIVRAHQVVEDGYEFFGNWKCVTVFSAPNYCNEFDNNAAVMSISEDLTCSFKILRPAEKLKGSKYENRPGTPPYK